MASFETTHIKTLREDLYDAIDYTKVLCNSLNGQTAMITGGSSGIGEATAKAFAYAGVSTIILTARTISTLEEVKSSIEAIKDVSSTPKVLIYRMDVTDIRSVSEVLAQVKQQGIRVDILIANAGVLEQASLIHEIDPETWWNTYTANVAGCFNIIHAILKEHMTASSNRNLKIVVTSSIGSQRTAKGMSAYQSSKSAVNRLIEFVDAEYAEHNVQAIAFHPGGIMTKLAENMPEDRKHLLSDNVRMPAGFLVWLMANQEACKSLAGRYCSANWDVTQLQEALKHIDGETLKTRAMP